MADFKSLSPDLQQQIKMIIETMGATPNTGELRQEDNSQGLEGLTRYLPITEDPVTGATVSVTEGGYPATNTGMVTLGRYQPASNTITYHAPIQPGSTTIPHERLHSAFRDQVNDSPTPPGILSGYGNYAGQFDWREDQDPALYPPSGLTTPQQHNMIDLLLNGTPEDRTAATNQLNQVPTPNRGTLKQLKMIQQIMDQHKKITGR